MGRQKGPAGNGIHPGRRRRLIDSRVRLLYAVDGNGKVLGVTSWLPTYRDGTIIGWTLDFMRHRTDSVNGIMEFLIARMAERLRDEDNVEFMSLSAAPLAGMGSSESEHEENEVLRHALQMVADIMEPAYGFHSLFRFKLKFHPDEEKVYICYPDAPNCRKYRLLWRRPTCHHSHLPKLCVLCAPSRHMIDDTSDLAWYQL